MTTPTPAASFAAGGGAPTATVADAGTLSLSPTSVVASTTATSAAGTAKPPSSHHGLSTGAAVGLTVGLIALLAGAGYLLALCLRRRKQRNAATADSVATAANPVVTPGIPPATISAAYLPNGSHASAFSPPSPKTDGQHRGSYVSNGASVGGASARLPSLPLPAGSEGDLDRIEHADSGEQVHMNGEAAARSGPLPPTLAMLDSNSLKEKGDDGSQVGLAPEETWNG